MTVTEVVPALLTVCPTIAPAWEEHLAFWHGEPERGAFNDVAVIARHLVDCVERGETAEFLAAFTLIEQCLVEGDEKVCELVAVGLLEGIQNIASHRSFAADVFYAWLGPVSRETWDELNQFWQHVAEAKTAGLLEPESGSPADSAIDPDSSQDPVLRRLVSRCSGSDRNGPDVFGEPAA